MTLRRKALPLILLLTGAGSVAVLPGCGSGNIPEILRGTTAKGGYWGACPRSPDDEQRHPQALSPEFNARLAKRFPQGSAEKALVSELAADGFRPAGSCETDPSIKFLAFDSKGRGAPSVSATVYWQADLSGRITWTKGFVAYTFL
jgi:hypothetical protein